MKMYEIIDVMLDADKEHLSVEYEQIAKYKRSLYKYFKDYFCCEPVCMVTSVTNNSCYMRIVPSNEFAECVECWINDSLDENDTDEDIEAHREYIDASSMMFSDLL